MTRSSQRLTGMIGFLLGALVSVGWVGTAEAAPSLVGEYRGGFFYSSRGFDQGKPLALTITLEQYRHDRYYVFRDTNTIGGGIEIFGSSKQCKLIGPKKATVTDAARCKLPRRGPVPELEVNGGVAPDIIDAGALPDLHTTVSLRGSTLLTSPLAPDSDLIIGSQGDDYIDGGMDSDVLIGNDGDDTIVDIFGADTIWGDRLKSPPTGSPGGDVIYVQDEPQERGRDSVSCGGGSDSVTRDPDDTVASDC